jgi:hypothetical protein
MTTSNEPADTPSTPHLNGQRKRLPRSRLTDGRTILPGVHSQSTWARLFRDMNDAMLAHVGGADYATEPQKLAARRVAVLEAELRFQEVKLAQIRAAGRQPPDELLDLYSRVSNTQRRHLETIGLQRVARDLTPSIHAYLRGESRPEETKPPPSR